MSSPWFFSLPLGALLLAVLTPLASAQGIFGQCGAINQRPCEDYKSCSRPFVCPLEPPCRPGLVVHDNKCVIESKPGLEPAPGIVGSVTQHNVWLNDAGLAGEPLKHTFNAEFVYNDRHLGIQARDATQFPLSLRLLPGPSKPPEQRLSINVYLENGDLALKINRGGFQEKPEVITIVRDLDPAMSDYRISILTPEDDRYQGAEPRLISFMWEWMNRAAAFFDGQRGSAPNRKIEIFLVPSKAASSYAETDLNLKPNGQPLIKFYQGYSFSSITSSIVTHEYGHKVMGDLYGKYYFAYSTACQTKHWPEFKIDQTCAFIEGWADVFAVFVTNDPVFRYVPRTFDYSADWGSRYAGGLKDMNGPGDRDPNRQGSLDAALRSRPNDPAVEGFVAHALLKYHEEAGVGTDVFLSALTAMGRNGSKPTLFEFTKALYGLADAEQKMAIRRLADRWALGLTFDDRDELRRSAPDPGALASFEHVGQFYSDDNFLYDDAASDKLGSLEACASWCLGTDQCESFTYAYHNPVSDTGGCTLFPAGAPRYPAKNDYQFYQRAR